MEELRKRCQDMPAETLRAEWAGIEDDIKDDLDAVSTIILCSRHQKRIADDVLHISKLSQCHARACLSELNLMTLQ